MQVNITGNKINFFHKSICFNKALIIGIVIVHHVHHLTMFKTLNLDAITIERSITFWTNDSVETASLCPLFYLVKKRVGYFLIINAVKR